MTRGDANTHPSCGEDARGQGLRGDGARGAVERSLSVAVIIPTYGRPDVLHETVLSLVRQSLAPVAVIIAAPDARQVRPETLNEPGAVLVTGRRGLTAQRNAALTRVPEGADLIAFLDDDIELADDYLAAMAALFARRSDVGLATGRVLLDGVRVGGIARARARAIVRAPRPTPDAHGEAPVEVPTVYGCNMVARWAIVRDIRFDERLPLYSWLEDLDFAHWCGQRGRVVRHAAARAVHLGVSSGRVSGTRVGFSQVMNSFYLCRKGSLPPGRMVAFYWAKPILSNALRSVTGDAHIDRPGRLRGNCIALWFLLRGRVEPEHILEIP